MILSNEEFLKLKKRDPEIFEKIYNTYKEDIYNYIMILSDNNKQLSDEVFSTTIVSALESVHTLKHNKNIFGWFMKITKNRFMDYLRNQYRIKNISDKVKINLQTENLSAQQDPVDQIVKNNKLTVLNLALNNIKPKYKDIIVLKYYKQLTHQQIAERVQKSRDAVESLLYRAITSLKKEVKKIGNFL